MSSTVFKAGAAMVDITPPLGGSLAGYMDDRRSQYVHDPLHVRCLVLDNGQTQLAFAVSDLVAIGGQQVAQAKHLIHGYTSIPLTNIMISATHSHTAATPAVLFQSDPDPVYLEWLVLRIADGVRCAAANLRPARVGSGIGREPGMVFNRRYHMKPGTVPPNSFGEKVDRVLMNPGAGNPNVVRPAGPVDPEVGVLAVQHVDGEPLAMLGNYALHYVGGNPGTDISADYFAAFSDEMGGLLGAPCSETLTGRPRFVGMMTNGCAGDINNIDVFAPAKPAAPYEQMRRVGKVVAAEAFKTWQTIAYQDWVPLAAREATLELRVRMPSGADVDRAKKILAGSGPELKGLEQIYARETVLLAEWPETRKTVVQAMRIGDLAIVTFPGEAFVELGLAVKKQSPFAGTLCVELANDYAGYIPTAEAFELGGYETWRARSSFLEKEAAAKMIARNRELLAELHSEATSQPTSGPSRR